MTELVYVPRKLVEAWKKKGWGVVYPDTEPDKKRGWAVLMHPPGWPDADEKKE